MSPDETITEQATRPKPVTTYIEKQIGKTLYRVTNIHKGEIDLGKTLEEIIVRKILMGNHNDN
jgi:hypothetical protein